MRENRLPGFRPGLTQTLVDKQRGLNFFLLEKKMVNGISDESTETTESYLKFNDELRWLWNLV